MVNCVHSGCLDTLLCLHFKGQVTRGIHFVFTIFVLESMLLQVVRNIFLLVVFLLVGFGDAVMYDDALIWFKCEDDLDAVQDSLVDWWFTLVV